MVVLGFSISVVDAAVRAINTPRSCTPALVRVLVVFASGEGVDCA